MTQKEALKILKTGANVFLTGAAGSGKTHILREYIDYLKNNGVNVGITASTGIAATHMNGMTIHSWTGIGIKDKLSNAEITALAEKDYLYRRIKNAEVLIIDEISMLHHFRLDLIDKLIRVFRGVDVPFGGLQVVVCGDFFQLPPVSRKDEPQAKFAYHSEVWEKLNFKICYLQEQHRQNDDQYLYLLNAIRGNNASEKAREMLNSRINKEPSAQEKPAKLYSHNADVDEENRRELEKLTGETFKYLMKSKGNPALAEILKKSCLAPESLLLKKGARVMFVKNNFEKGYANGTLGVVENCGDNYITVRTSKGRSVAATEESWRIEDQGKTKAEIIQYPLRLAWAITVHKSQGMSLDAAEVDLSQSFEKGMGYVALSRVRSLEGLFVKGFNDTALLVNEEVLEFDRNFCDISCRHAQEINKISAEDLDKLHSKFANKNAGKKKNIKPNTVLETKKLVASGLPILQIAKDRGLKKETIISHLEKIKEKYPDFDFGHLSAELSADRFDKISAAFQKAGDKDGTRPLSPVKSILGDDFSYDEIRLARLFL